MRSPDRLSASKKLCTAAILMVAASLLPSNRAMAATLDYTFSGVASGSFDGSPMGSGAFSLTFAEDTSTIVDAGSDYYRYNDITALLASGGVSVTIPNVTIVVNGASGYENVDFYNADFFNGLGLSLANTTNTSLLNYALATPVDTGLITVAADLTPTFNAVGDGFTDTAGDTIQFTGDTSLEFAAVAPASTTATPEPASIVLLTTALSGVGLLRRRLQA